jgi:hypothetical protein
MNPHRKFILTIAFVFVATSLLFLVAKKLIAQWDIDMTVLMAANFLLFAISIITSMIQRSALNNKNPNVFIRSVMMSMLIKMFACAIGVLIYATVSGDKFNGKAIFVFMLLYIVYQVAEVRSMLKLNKNTNA